MVFRTVPNRKKLDLDKAKTKYLRHAVRRGLSPASVTSYERHIERFISFARKRKRRTIDDVRPTDLEAFGKHLDKHDFSATTCGQSRSILDKWLRYLAHEGEVDTSMFPADSGRRRKWSRDKIVTTLRRLHRQGVAISYPGLRNAGHGNVTNAACRYFGSLTAARSAAGLDH